MTLTKDCEDAAELKSNLLSPQSLFWCTAPDNHLGFGDIALHIVAKIITPTMIIMASRIAIITPTQNDVEHNNDGGSDDDEDYCGS